MQSFAYTAEQFDGQSVRGTIEADDLADAERRLTALRLRVLSLAPVAAAPRPVRLGVTDLQTFNELLLQISRAGVPMEAGLAALSGEVASGKLKDAIDALVADLQTGMPLEQAVDARRDAFPPLYGRLIDAGIRAADLPGVLGRFGRHLLTVNALRDALWRACAYPLVVLVALLALLTFLGYGVLPNYLAMIGDTHYQTLDRHDWRLTRPGMHLQPPAVAVAVEYLGRATPWLAGAAVLAGLGGWAYLRALRGSGRERALLDELVRLPLVGRALRDSYVASWLDVAALGATAGMDLPQALRLAGDAVALPSVQHDADAMARQIEAGRPVGDVRLTRLPATLPLAMDIADGPGQLPRLLTSLAGEYQRQAERQIGLIPARVMPALLIAVGAVALAVLYSLWAPLAVLLRALTTFA